MRHENPIGTRIERGADPPRAILPHTHDCVHLPRVRASDQRYEMLHPVRPVLCVQDHCLESCQRDELNDLDARNDREGRQHPFVLPQTLPQRDHPVSSPPCLGSLLGWQHKDS